MKFHLSVKRAVLTLGILLAAGVLTVVFAAKKNDNVIYTAVPVERGELVQSVQETGTVKAAQEVSLSFPRGGKVAIMRVAVGDIVATGDVLAELDHQNLDFSKNEASANLDVAQSNLRKLLAGATMEEIAVAQASVNQARAAYESAKAEFLLAEEAAVEAVTQAQKNLDDLEGKTVNYTTTYAAAVISAQSALQSAGSTYQKAIDNSRSVALNTMEDKSAVANKALDTISRTLDDEDGKDYISLKNMSLLTQTELSHKQGVDALALAVVLLAQAKNSQDDEDTLAALDEFLIALNIIFKALENCYNALENSVTSSVFTQTELDALKSGISGQQTTVGTAVSATQAANNGLKDSLLAYDTNVEAAENNLTQAQAAYDSALTAARHALTSARLSGDQQIALARSKESATRQAWQVAETQLKRTMAAADQNDIDLARARVRQAQAALASVNEQIDNSYLKAEMDGTVVRTNFKAGEQAGAGAPAVTLLNGNNFEIELLVSEADIAKLKTGNPATITLDAYGDEVEFFGQVGAIEPAATVLHEVIYYKVKVNFQPGETDIRSGMTANIVIITARRDNTIYVPNRAVVEKNGGDRYVRVLAGNDTLEKPVTVGLRGDQGMVEILSGLNEGELAITHVRDK
jgi:HlyD family secretion protein